MNLVDDKEKTVYINHMNYNKKEYIDNNDILEQFELDDFRLDKNITNIDLHLMQADSLFYNNNSKSRSNLNNLNSNDK